VFAEELTHIVLAEVVNEDVVHRTDMVKNSAGALRWNWRLQINEFTFLLHGAYHDTMELLHDLILVSMQLLDQFVMLVASEWQVFIDARQQLQNDFES